MLPVFSVPLLCLALVAWAAGSRRLSTAPRWLALVAAIALACGVMTLLRTGGVGGGNLADLHWRWTETPEERLLAQGDDDVPVVAPVPAPPARESTPAPAIAAPTAAISETTETLPAPAVAPVRAAWPGFRGPDRDGIVRGVRIDTDWSAKPPVALWRRPIGPGWSSFAVRGDVLYTQEQRGEDEIVAAYNVSTGQPVWRHRDAARFWESNGRRRSARNADAQRRRSRLHVWRDWNPECTRRGQRQDDLVAQCRVGSQSDSARTGVSRARHWSSTMWSSLRCSVSSRPTIAQPASSAGWARFTVVATPRRI